MAKPAENASILPPAAAATMALAAECTLPSQFTYKTMEMAKLAAARCLYLMPGHWGVHPARQSAHAPQHSLAGHTGHCEEHICVYENLPFFAASSRARLSSTL